MEVKLHKLAIITCEKHVQCRPVIRKPHIRKSGYKKGAGRVPAELLFVIT
jgi:hypothetical protein